MSKRPTPKKQHEKFRGRQRYAQYVLKQTRKLMNIAKPLVGRYKGADLNPKKSDGGKITKIAA